MITIQGILLNTSMNRDWWDGDMFNNDFSPYDEMQSLKLENINQRRTINTLLHQSNRMQELLVEISKQHQNIVHEYGNFIRRLNTLEQEIGALRANTPNINTPLE